MELLKETLSELLSPHLETREDAKRRIEVLKRKEKFGEDLTIFFIGPVCELTIKELAITILKEWIEIHWTPSIPNFLPPATTPKTKNMVVFTCLSILRESNTELYNVVQIQACEILTILFGFVLKWYEDESNVIPTYLEPHAPSICEYFVRILKEKNCPSSNILLKSAVFKAITKLCDEMPKLFFDSSTEILPPLWENFMDTAKTYREFEIDGSGDYKDKNENFDDKTVSDYENLITSMLDFIKELLNRPAMFDFGPYTISEYHWFHLQASISPDVLQALISLMELTERQIQLWADNPSQFIKEEEREWNMLQQKIPCSIRNKAHTVVNFIIGNSGSYPARTTEHDLTNVIIKQFIDEIESGRPKRQRMNNWKQHEAYLLAFCTVKSIIDDRFNEERLHFELDYFFEKIILPDLKYSQTPPLLMCQCLRLGRLFIQYMDIRMKKRFVEATINCLGENKSMCTRITAAKSAHCWFQVQDSPWLEDTVDKNKLHSRIPALFDKLLDLGNQSMSPEVLWLVLENLAVLTPLKKGTASGVNKICKFTVAAFLKFHNDHTVLDYCRNYFQKLALNPKFTGLLQEHLIPALIDMMTAGDPSNELAGTAHIRAIFVLKLLVKNQLEPLEHNSVLIKSALPALYYCMLIHTDQKTLISGAEVICHYLSAAALQAIECKDIDGKTGSQYILQIASHLLKPESRGCLVKSACTIVTLLVKNNHKLAESIDDLVKALITRLWVESEDDTQRQLLVVCARLITQFDTVYKYLSNVSGPNGQSALSFIVYDGFCKKHKSFNPDERKLINLALATLLDYGITYNDHRLSEVTVQEGEKGMETTIPLLVGITKFIRAMLSEEAGSI